MQLTQAKRNARNHTRHLTNELLDGLRGIHPQALVLPVFKNDTLENWEYDRSRPYSVGKAHKVINVSDKWTACDYAAMVLATERFDPETLVYQQIMLAEPDFYAARDWAMLEGYACGHETFNLSPNLRHDPHTHTCEMCNLLATKYQVYRIGANDELRRNEEHISKGQQRIADKLMERAKVIDVKAQKPDRKPLPITSEIKKLPKTLEERIRKMIK